MLLGLGKSVLRDQHRGDAAACERVPGLAVQAALQRGERVVETAGAVVEIGQRHAQCGVARIGAQIRLMARDRRIVRCR